MLSASSMWDAPSADCAREEEDPFVGDLNNWEFLTVFFDHDNFLDDQVSTSTPSETFTSIKEGPNDDSLGAASEYLGNTSHHLDCRHSCSGYPVSAFIAQTSSSARVSCVLLGDDCHRPCGIPSHNLSMSLPSLHFQEQQAMSYFSSPHYVHHTSSTSSFNYQNRDFGIFAPGEFMNDPVRITSSQAAERLNVRRVPMDISGFSNGAYSSCHFLNACQQSTTRCKLGPTLKAQVSLSSMKSSRDNIQVVDAKESRQKESLFFDYSPPLPSHDLLKPLTAYNFFYRDERDNIISGMLADGDPIPPALCDFSEAKLRQMLNQRWYVDPGKKKRSHRKTHGKLPFETLSKIIGLRWQDLSDEGREFYRWVAKLDQAQYRRFIVAKEAADCEKATAHTGTYEQSTTNTNFPQF